MDSSYKKLPYTLENTMFFDMKSIPSFDSFSTKQCSQGQRIEHVILATLLEN